MIVGAAIIGIAGRAAASFVIFATICASGAQAEPHGAVTPKPRPEIVEAGGATHSGMQVLAGRRLKGEIGYVLMDAATGEMLDAMNANEEFIPASVSKAPTALYALDALGRDYRFETRLIATGDVVAGVLEGDLYLQGGADPELDTDGLATLATRLSLLGVRRVQGGFYYDDEAIPYAPQIDGSQPVQAAYNPSVSGLNLNFNRVLLSWKRKGKGKGAYELSLQARARNWSPEVETVAYGLLPDKPAQRDAFQYGKRDGRELWLVSRRYLGREGSRWLPVQQPGRYTAGVFRAVAEKLGVNLPEGARRRAPVLGRVIATHVSAPLSEIVRDMLKYSTNLTAEAIGVSASAARGLPVRSIADSGAAMSRWVAETIHNAPSVDAPMRFDNHSGLAVGSRVSANQMALLLRAADRGSAALHPDIALHSDAALLSALLPQYKIDNRKGETLIPGAHVVAKSGTLYFARGLAGYLDIDSGRRLIFAIFSSDKERRKRLDAEDAPDATENPPGGRDWLIRARGAERALLRNWAMLYAG